MTYNQSARCTSLLYMDDIEDPSSNFAQWTSIKKVLKIGATEMQKKIFKLFLSMKMYSSMSKKRMPL